MADKTATIDEAVALVPDGATVGIGGWGSRRKPMALVRALANSSVRDLTVVSYGGPDVGLLLAAGKVRRLVTGFVTLDSIPLEPHFQRARAEGTVELTEWDEGMFQWGLLAASHRLPFLPMRAGLGSDVPRLDTSLRTVTSPYADGEELTAVPALTLDVALVHQNRADARGNAQYLGPDPYFDDLFVLAATTSIVSTERIVPTDQLLKEGPLQSLRIPRLAVDAVVETPGGGHFTTAAPDYERDERFQKAYAAAAKDPEAWPAFHERHFAGDEAHYQRSVDAFHAENGSSRP
ncbi:CoA transferase subunit A [Pseudonocardia lutea]|uniref:CoA transferase subunit A n=1 Tax=Pseudonocardia lutea TaxID=2172015 RepID=A0ABW1IBH9_9PSEU